MGARDLRDLARFEVHTARCAMQEPLWVCRAIARRKTLGGNMKNKIPCSVARYGPGPLR